MIETVEIKINGKKYRYNKGITIEDIIMEQEHEERPFPILIARIGNRIRELSYKIEDDCEIELLDLTCSEGNRVHVNGLILILLYVIDAKLGRDAKVRVEHSIDKGLYIKTKFKLEENKLDEIREGMKEVISRDLPITRFEADRLEAKEYYESVGEITKANVLSYSTNNFVTLYRLGNIYEYFYYYMPTSTAKVRDFELTYLDEHSFILRFPTVYIHDKIKEYEHHKHIFEVFDLYKRWSELISVRTAVDLNKVVSTGKIGDLIKMDEAVHTHRLLTMAKEIYDNRKRIKVILLAGPSSSGKTTTSKKLCVYLNILGLHPVAVSMDNYFVERKDNPKNEKGEYDFECLEAVDLDLFDKQIKDLVSGKTVLMSTYNFFTGKKEFNEELKLEENEILIIEGIHALDPKILTNVPRENKFKIYISPLAELIMDNHNRIPTTDLRLLRRIIRDNRTRNYSVDETLKHWANVRLGEEKYIFPYQDECDAMINSAAIYEMGVLKTYVEPLLYSVDSNSEFYEETKRLLNCLRLFLPIPSETIPDDAVIREFIGGCYYRE